MKLVTAIVRPDKLDSVRGALENYGVQGLTVSQASGYGRQRGHTEIYRGAEYTVDLLQKARVEVLVSHATLRDRVEVMLATADTVRAGDGKVWVLPVEDAVRVRTGERGEAAL